MKKKTYIAPSIEIHIMEASDTFLAESKWGVDEESPIVIVEGNPGPGISLGKNDNWGNLWNDDLEDEEEY